MNNRSWCIALVTIMVAFSSCKKEETVVVHEDLVVTGNNPPPYDGITSVQVANYVNRLYIDLISEPPTEAQLNAHVAALQANDLDAASRTLIVDSLLNTTAYYERYFVQTSSNLLEGISKDLIDEEILTQQFIADFYYQNGDTAFGQIVDYQVALLINLRNADADYQTGAISINQFYSRFIFNGIYDEINMGSENFVVACFENLFKRNPSVNELASGVGMVDAQPSILFLQSGDSKLDFVNIVTTTDEFYLGLVLDTYFTLLLRSPNSEEMSQGSIDLTNTGDLTALQRELLISDEYAGF